MHKLTQTLILSSFSVFTLILGLSFFMMKSPERLIENYQTVAADYVTKAQDVYLMESASLYLLDEADYLLRQAALLNPYDRSLLLERKAVAGYKANAVKSRDTAFLPHKEIIQ